MTSKLIDIRCASCAEPVSSLGSPELLEALADVEHKRWAGWMDYLVGKSMPVAGGVLIPVDLAQHWAHLCNTAYADLEEHSKESDRKEVRKTLAVIHKYLSCPRGHDDGLMDVGHRPVDRPLSDEMHPTGWCSCAGEGTCEWCKWRASTDKPSAEADEIIERLRRKCGGECGVEDCLWHLAADALDATNKALLRWQTDTMIEGDFVCADGSIATGTFSKE